jgi:hypothetical protein
MQSPSTGFSVPGLPNPLRARHRCRRPLAIVVLHAHFPQIFRMRLSATAV